MFSFLRRKPRSQSRSRKLGSVLIAALILSFILMATVGGITRFSTDQTIQVARYEVNEDEFAAAEAALNKAYAQIEFMIRSQTPNMDAVISAMTAPTVAGFDFPTFSVVKTFDGAEPVTSGQYSGLTLYRRRYDITVTAKANQGKATRFQHPGVTLSQQAQITNIPLFIYAIFYNPEMEIHPGQTMTVNGRVHSNVDAYFGSDASLSVTGRVTSAGGIYGGRSPAAQSSGIAIGTSPVSFYNGSTQVPFKVSSGTNGDDNGINASGNPTGSANGFFDAPDSTWQTGSQSRWNEWVKDAANGVAPLNPPIPTGIDPHVLIERAVPGENPAIANEKFENKAGMKILRTSATTVTINGTSYTLPSPPGVTPAVAGTVPRYGPAPGTPIVTTATIYDGRENAMVELLTVDMGGLISTGTYPSNGILYVSNEGTNGAVRLTNGATIPNPPLAGGFSVASDDPIYVKGDYNKNNPTKALVAGDAIKILSNAWNDANHDTNGESYNGSETQANQTTTNMVVMNGIVESTSASYSGGVENYFRYLEKWGSGAKHIFKGSIVSLWTSQKQVDPWRRADGRSYYTPPFREWSWDTNLANGGPPGTPVVLQLDRLAWQKVGY